MDEREGRKSEINRDRQRGVHGDAERAAGLGVLLILRGEMLAGGRAGGLLRGELTLMVMRDLGGTGREQKEDAGERGEAKAEA